VRQQVADQVRVQNVVQQLREQRQVLAAAQARRVVRAQELGGGARLWRREPFLVLRAHPTAHELRPRACR
jgi:hypothetical protein